MGEAKLRRARLDALKRHWRFCIYCGGTMPGDTVEHVPPIAMFNNRARPKGLELLACKPCNQGSKGDDQVASLISRIAGSDRSMFPVDIAETQKLRREVATNHPHLMQEIHWNTPEGITECMRLGIVPFMTRLRRTDGPLFRATMKRFTSKVGLALHAHSTGRILSAKGVVCAWPVFRVREQRIPMIMFAGFASPATLEQGNFSVRNQFFYTYRSYGEGSASIHYAQFRDGFGMWAYCAEDISLFNPPPKDGMALHPGFLKVHSRPKTTNPSRNSLKTVASGILPYKQR